MVAAMILVLGAIAIFKIVDAATRTSYRAEQSQVVSNLLQRELERVKAMAPAQMVVNSDSSPSVSACLTERTAAATQGAAGGTAVTPIAANKVIEAPGGAITPCEDASGSAEDGSGSSDVNVRVFRFVTWFDPDRPDCQIPGPDVDINVACGMRRIVIGAIPTDTGPGGERAYKEIQADVVDVQEG